MGIRREVEEFVHLGRLPSEDASVEDLAAHQTALQRIARPVSPEEAEVLMRCFPRNDESCYGLAWRLLHLLETAGESLELPREPPDEPWLARLWKAAERGRRRGG
jgi:hypothetical protein